MGGSVGDEDATKGVVQPGIGVVSHQLRGHLGGKAEGNWTRINYNAVVANHERIKRNRVAAVNGQVAGAVHNGAGCRQGDLVVALRHKLVDVTYLDNWPQQIGVKTDSDIRGSAQGKPLPGKCGAEGQLRCPVGAEYNRDTCSG